MGSIDGLPDSIHLPSYIIATTIIILQRLFDAVYDEGFTYVVHVDVKSDRALIDGVAAYLGVHKGAHLIPSVRYIV